MLPRRLRGLRGVARRGPQQGTQVRRPSIAPATIASSPTSPPLSARRRAQLAGATAAARLSTAAAARRHLPALAEPAARRTRARRPSEVVLIDQNLDGEARRRYSRRRQEDPLGEGHPHAASDADQSGGRGDQHAPHSRSPEQFLAIPRLLSPRCATSLAARLFHGWPIVNSMRSGPTGVRGFPL